MIKIFNENIKQQKNFWSGCVFHPTDAIEDPWEKRILDQIAKDKACKYVRIYTMFEDIVYTLTSEQIAILREEGKLKPIPIEKGLQSVDLTLTAGATFLITVE